MLKVSLIGHLGANAEIKNANGKEFTTMRIAHTDKWKDAAGVSHEQTTWVDVIINDKPAVLPYLQRGQMVFVEGTCALRVYSSPKDRCMKAGLTINARSIELLGGKNDEIPAALYSPADGVEHKVTKHYYCEDIAMQDTITEDVELHSRSGEIFNVSPQGWVTKQQPE